MAWEEGRSARLAAGKHPPAVPVPTYEDGRREGLHAGRAEARRLVQLLADKSELFLRRREGRDLRALEDAIDLAHRWTAELQEDA